MVSVRALGIAAVAIIAVIAVAYLIVPSVNLPNSMNLQWSAYGLKDGRRVTPPLAFLEQGIEIDALGATASWVAQGDSVDWTTLTISGRWSILLRASDGSDSDITPSDLSQTWTESGEMAKTGSSSFEASLETLVLGQPFTGRTIDLNYWTVTVRIHLSGSVDQSVGDGVLSDSLDAEHYYFIYWEDGTFSLTGGIE